jgi:hypothetical protein
MQAERQEPRVQVGNNIVSVLYIMHVYTKFRRIESKIARERTNRSSSATDCPSSTARINTMSAASNAAESFFAPQGMLTHMPSDLTVSRSLHVMMFTSMPISCQRTNRTSTRASVAYMLDTEDDQRTTFLCLARLEFSEVFWQAAT